MESPTGIIPEDLMYPQRLGAVMDWLKRQHADSEQKINVFRGWAVTVGVKLSASQIQAVANTGVDRGGPHDW